MYILSHTICLVGSSASAETSKCSTNPTYFSSKLLTFDRLSNILVLHILLLLIQEGINLGSGPKRNIRLLKANYIKEFNFLGRGEDPLDLKKCFIDLNNLKGREDSVIRQAELEAEIFGIDVTAETQSIFYALFKTLPVHWDKTTIVWHIWGCGDSGDFLKDFHRRRVQVLADSGADLIAFETIPNRLQAMDYAEILEEENIKVPTWFSYE
ncbi:unnamed protein product [Coffea canephora]|uniref:LSM12 anticodon-binding domain-containing protein n=1 Tax=Coffea canephora TaxID=49390 RepID=A0A068UMC5_COFCA|nr:unnamed protein product [Coffea canephora]